MEIRVQVREREQEEEQGGGREEEKGRRERGSMTLASGDRSPPGRPRTPLALPLSSDIRTRVLAEAESSLRSHAIFPPLLLSLQFSPSARAGHGDGAGW